MFAEIKYISKVKLLFTFSICLIYICNITKQGGGKSLFFRVLIQIFRHESEFEQLGMSQKKRK